MINFQTLESQFASNLPHYDFFGLDSVDSTNSFLKRQANDRLVPSICICNNQTEGYGQRSRQWCSNEDSLTFSFMSRLQVPIHQVDGLSQAVGLILVAILNQYIEQKLHIKWPNDIYSDQGKVAGLLIESVKYDKDSCWLIVGIGINFSQIDLNEDKSGNTAAYLKPLDSIKVLRPIIFSKLIYELDKLFSIFHFGYFAEIINHYKKYDYFDFDQELIVYDTGHVSKGLYKGLTQFGELLFEIDGDVKTYRSGDVSIRAV